MAPALTFIIRPTAPFRLDLTVWALRRRARNLIDRWDGSTYRRVISLGGRPTELVVRQAELTATPRLIVSVTPSPRDARGRGRVRTMVDRLLGIHVDLSGWYRMAARDARLQPLAERFRGVKPPRFLSIVETLINAFACQQLSLEVGLELLNRLATVCGGRVRSERDVNYSFPDTRAMARLPAARYRELGFSRQKARAIVELTRAIARRDLDLETLDRESDTAARQRLLALRGVGRWTAEYALLRGLGRLHVFPGDDVGAQKRLACWLGRGRPFDYAGVERAVERWHPYAGMVYFHLLLDGLSQRGVLEHSPALATRSAR